MAECRGPRSQHLQTQVALANAESATGPVRTHASIRVADETGADVEFLKPFHWMNARSKQYVIISVCSRSRRLSWRCDGRQRLVWEATPDNRDGIRTCGERITKKLVTFSRAEAVEEPRDDLAQRPIHSYAWRQSSSFARLVRRHNQQNTPSGSAPAPIAVLLMTSPHHSCAPPRYTGCSCCTCLSASITQGRSPGGHDYGCGSFGLRSDRFI